MVNRKQRPKLEDAWRGHTGLNLLSNTIEECWDQDAEARVSASCVMERIKSFQHLANSIEPTIPSLPSSNNNRNASVISPTDLRMNALNDQQTAQAAGVALGASTPLPITTSHSVNLTTSSSPTREFEQDYVTPERQETRPLLFSEPPSTIVISDNNNFPISPSLANIGHNDKRVNSGEEEHNPT